MIAERGPVALEVFDALGRRVAVLAEGDLDAGRYEATLAANGLAGGVYVVRLRAGDDLATRTLVLVR